MYSPKEIKALGEFYDRYDKGSGIQPEQEPKCKICKDTGEDRTGENPDEVYSCPDCEPEQTEDEKIRSAFEKEYEKDFWELNDDPELEREYALEVFTVGYKSRQQEIDELKGQVNINRDTYLNFKVLWERAESKLSEKDNQIESMKCFIDEIIPWIGKVGSGSAIRDIYANWKQKP